MKIYEANSGVYFLILLIFYAAELNHLPRMFLLFSSGPLYTAELATIGAKLNHLPRMSLLVSSGPFYTAELATIGAAGFSVVGSAMETAASCSGSC